MAWNVFRSIGIKQLTKIVELGSKFDEIHCAGNQSPRQNIRNAITNRYKYLGLKTIFLLLMLISKVSSARSRKILDSEHRRLPQGMYIDYWHCGRSAWEVNYTDSHQISSHNLIQEFLEAWNHNPKRCQGFANFGNRGLHFGGIGQSYFYGLTFFAEALEQGHAFAPYENYFWAQPYKVKIDPFFHRNESYWIEKRQDCTLNKPRLDCYFEEISNCDNPTLNPKDEYNTTLGRMIWQTPPSGNAPIDSCRLGIILKKSLAWVAGEYLRYIIRPRSDVLLEMSPYRILPPRSELNNTSIVTIHYRGGQPDWGRRVSPLDVYMNALKIKAAELEAMGRPVSLVYLTSVNNTISFVSEEYMHSKYPAPYRYVISRRKQHDKGDIENEYFLYMNSNISRASFVYEMLADAEAMVEADCLIGSISNIYLVITFLRYAVRLDAWKNKKFNCYIDDNGQLICEDDERKHEIYNRYMFDHGQAFTDGTPF